jgi:hypothetical protein
MRKTFDAAGPARENARVVCRGLEEEAMSKCVRWSQVAALCGAVGLALLALGCGEQDEQDQQTQADRDREAKLEEMARHLKSNTNDRLFVPSGLSLKRDYWVDKQRSRESTVRQTLIEVGATLRDGKVVDPAGKELYFYHVEDPWGRSSRQKEDEELRRRIKAELDDLEKSGHRVMLMYTPPSYPPRGN